MTHLSRKPRQVRQNEPPLEDVFGCLWAECGFECVNSAEMVRHINFHSHHTKIKCHGLNMLASHGLQPCVLDPGQRNILPDLSEPFTCEWEGCEQGPPTIWDHPLYYYSHVSAHGEEVSSVTNNAFVIIIMDLLKPLYQAR